MYWPRDCQERSLNRTQYNVRHAASSRRDFARLLALSGTAALLPGRARDARADALARSGLTSEPLPQTPAQPTEKFWQDVRKRFLIPREVAFFNAANLCPACLPAIEAHEKHLRAYEADPSPAFRSELMKQREESRRLLAAALRVTPEEIVITRNTSEGNNVVSSGLDLKPGDEVIVWADNHPTNLTAWQTKAKRFGFTVVTVPVMSEPGPLESTWTCSSSAMTPQTKVIAITHVSSNSGAPAAGRRDLRGSAQARDPLARRRRPGVRRAGPRPRRDEAGLLHGLHAQVAVRAEGEGPPLHQPRRAGSDSPAHRRLSTAGRSGSRARSRRTASATMRRSPR